MAALNGQSITGDAVRLEDDERLDKPDALALQSLIFETMIRSFGGLFGGSLYPSTPWVGWLNAPSTSWNAGSKVVTFGPGLLLDGGTLSSPSGSSGARVVRHDPTLAGQTSTLDLTSYHPATQCVIWARRTYTSTAVPGVPGALDTRKRWNTSDDEEESFSTYTRFGERVEWTAAPATIVSNLVTSATYPSGSGWVPAFRVTWSAGTPSFYAVAWCDCVMNGTTMTEAGARVVTGSGAYSYGLGFLSQAIRNQIAYLRDNTGNTNWQSDATTYRGVKQLDTDLTTAESDINTLQAAVAERANFGVITAFTLVKSGGSWVFEYPATAGDARIGTWGTFSSPSFYAGFTLSGVTFTEVTSVQVTMFSDGTAPSPLPTPTAEIVDSVTGEFKLYFWDSGSKVEPDAMGFMVTVNGTYV
jgi:hypothetical protein